MQRYRQKVVSLWHVLTAHHTKIVDILPIFKDAQSALTIMLRISPHEVHSLPVCISNTGYIQEPLIVELGIEFISKIETKRSLELGFGRSLGIGICIGSARSSILALASLSTQITVEFINPALGISHSRINLLV